MISLSHRDLVGYPRQAAWRMLPLLGGCSLQSVACTLGHQVHGMREYGCYLQLPDAQHVARSFRTVELSHDGTEVSAAGSATATARS